MATTEVIVSRQARADQHYERCLLCEHRCGANRRAGERGPCKAGAEARVFRHRIEVGEELELIPSHLFYLSGCDLRCAFCIAEENAFDPRRGVLLTGEFLAEAVEWGRARGARNIQWVGGEPTIHIPSILQAMGECSQLSPIVWKSDFYGTPDAFDLLQGVVDIYVADLKFGQDECARRIAGVDNYFAVVTRNLKTLAATSNLIIRHLLLPGHFDCCFRPIARWLGDNMPNAKFSIRDGYMPKWRAKHVPELATCLDRHDSVRAHSLSAEQGLNVIS
jgi:putative pyruvate formate lyase activating enzyme